MTALSPVGRQIQEALATFLRRDPATIQPHHHLRDDLRLDSLMTFELLYELEKAFEFEIPNEDLPGLHTLSDIITYVEARLDSGKTPPEALQSKGKDRPQQTTSPRTARGKPTTSSATKKRGTGSTVKKRTTPAKPKGNKA